MVGEVTLVLEYGARASRCKRCKDGIAREKLRAVKGKGSTRQLLHPSCFFQWLRDQILGKEVTQANEGPWQFHDSLETNGSQGLRGFDELRAEEQAEVEQLLVAHLASVTRARAPVVGPAVGGAVHGPQVDGPQPDGPPGGGPQLPPPPLMGPVLVISSDSEGDDDGQPPAKVPRLQTEKKGSDEKEGLPAATSTPGRKMPNMLEGVKIPEGVERTGDECSVCLDPPVHPVSLPCGHIFCYLCAKGLGAGLGAAKLCSLCRRPIPHGFLESAEVLSKASQELNDTPPVDATEQQWQWFYEGRNGWWRFESRNNEDLEEAFRGGKQQVETLICGNIYVINLASMEQFQKSMPQRKRRIKRDLKSAQCKGVAGLGKSSWQ